MIAAIMNVVSVNLQPGTQPGSGYVVQVAGFVTPDTATGPVDGEFVTTVAVPFATNRNKRDELVREGFAAFIFTATGLTIDPDDIYVPFASK